ncbi:MAG: DUF2165 domain-containing protein [Alphaproteobacteria bacterium]|nr:DUF2165 domain-containing protein [Alphaproteobacteria bacterium]
MPTALTVKLAKTVLVFSIGLFAALAGIGNILDPATNYSFVEHVLTMDTVFPNNPLAAQRAITDSTLHKLAFWLIVLTELVVAGLCFWGTIQLLMTMRSPAVVYNAAKGPAVAGLCLAVVLWFTGFVAVGGEWFLMWQSSDWNGIAAAFRFAASAFLALIFLVLEDRD